jgi:CRP-like cAMP-binding protein/Fe-S-cluster-containing hydrogenase component 2
MAKQLVVNPPVELERRPTDVELSADQFLKVSLFSQMKQKPSFDKFPGAVRLRRYAPGEVICRQGEAGFTAFYLLTTEDALALRRDQAEAAELEARLARLQGQAPGSDARRAATAYLAIARPAERSVGPLTRLARRLFPAPARTQDRQPLYVPMDGPTDIDYESRQAALFEGEVFGEMSCLRRTPRSATVVADGDCYALEMLRNIFDTLCKDAGHKARTDEAYRKRVLDMQLRNLPLFARLTERQLDEARAAVELATFEAGDVIWSEGDPSDSLCIIRSGVVRVTTTAGGPPRTLAYCSRGELLGEVGLILGQPRSATCVAAGHPNDEGGRVELVRMSAEFFAKLIADSRDLKEEVEKVAAARQQRSREAEKIPVWDEGGSPLNSKQAVELGLVQGQRLMLIDLDRCTRCDECVRACVNTHDDGQSRLFLDGPRFANYLVPTTCRSCLDPVCMIGCPVGAIHRGDNGEIRIENWCIGCVLCAKNCPYGSIQMRDLGLIPEEAHGWRYRPAATVTDGRWQERAPSGRWAAGSTPFAFDRDFRDSLGVVSTPGAVVPICFSYEFRLGAEVLREDSRFKMEVTSVDPEAAVWLNGRELKTDQKAKRGKREFPFGREVLRAGRNVVAARVAGVVGSSDVLFGLRLDEVRRPAVPRATDVEVTEKPVTQRAVVCDLCSDGFGQVPACVNACPHDAALRVDARQFDFLPR